MAPMLKGNSTTLQKENWLKQRKVKNDFANMFSLARTTQFLLCVSFIVQGGFLGGVCFYFLVRDWETLHERAVEIYRSIDILGDLHT